MIKKTKIAIIQTKVLNSKEVKINMIYGVTDFL